MFHGLYWSYLLPILCLIFFALCLKYNAMTFVKHCGKLLAKAEVYLTC